MRNKTNGADWECAGTHLYSAALGFFDGCRLRLPAEMVSVMVDAQIAALKHVGLTITTPPPSPTEATDDDHE